MLNDTSKEIITTRYNNDLFGKSSGFLQKACDGKYAQELRNRSRLPESD